MALSAPTAFVTVNAAGPVQPRVPVRRVGRVQLIAGADPFQGAGVFELLQQLEVEIAGDTEQVADACLFQAAKQELTLVAVSIMRPVWLAAAAGRRAAARMLDPAGAMREVWAPHGVAEGRSWLGRRRRTSCRTC